MFNFHSASHLEILAADEVLRGSISASSSPTKWILLWKMKINGLHNDSPLLKLIWIKRKGRGRESVCVCVLLIVWKEWDENRNTKSVWIPLDKNKPWWHAGSSKILNRITIHFSNIYFWVCTHTHKKLKAGTQTDICTCIFIPALFITAKRWKHPSIHPHTWINKMWYTPTMEYLSLKKGWDSDTCYNMN